MHKMKIQIPKNSIGLIVIVRSKHAHSPPILRRIPHSDTDRLTDTGRTVDLGDEFKLDRGITGVITGEHMPETASIRKRLEEREEGINGFCTRSSITTTTKTIT